MDIDVHLNGRPIVLACLGIYTRKKVLRKPALTIVSFGWIAAPQTVLAHHDGAHGDPWTVLGLGLLMLAVLLATVAARYDRGGPTPLERAWKNRRWLNLPVAEAHCDIPCGIYDPTPMQIAAVSVLRFLDQLAELDSSTQASLSDRARLTRLIAEKESHAQEVKDAAVVIWGDYFNAARIEAHPEIHELTHAIMKAASTCKQEVERENGERLVELVNQFAEIFWATKGVSTRRAIVAYKPGVAIVQPELADAG